jgi:hypothetical protein
MGAMIFFHDMVGAYTKARISMGMLSAGNATTSTLNMFAQIS